MAGAHENESCKEEEGRKGARTDIPCLSGGTRTCCERLNERPRRSAQNHHQLRAPAPANKSFPTWKQSPRTVQSRRSAPTQAARANIHKQSVCSEGGNVQNAAEAQGGIVFEDVGGENEVSRQLAAGERLTADHLERMGGYLPTWIEQITESSSILGWTVARIENQLVLINTLAKSKALVKACKESKHFRGDRGKPLISKASDRLAETSGSRHQKLTRLLIFVALEGQVDKVDHGDTSASWEPEDMVKGLESAKEAKDKAVRGGGRAASRKGPAQGGDGIGARTSGDVSAEMTIQDVGLIVAGLFRSS